MSIGTWTVSNSTLRRTKRGRGYWEYWRRVLTVNKFVWYCCLPFGFKMTLKHGILLSVIFLLLAFSANGIEFEGKMKWKYCWLSWVVASMRFGPKLTFWRKIPRNSYLRPSALENCLVLFWSLATALMIHFFLVRNLLKTSQEYWSSKTTLNSRLES